MAAGSAILPAVYGKLATATRPTKWSGSACVGAVILQHTSFGSTQGVPGYRPACRQAPEKSRKAEGMSGTRAIGAGSG